MSQTLAVDEKRGRNGFKAHEANLFKEVLESCSLFDRGENLKQKIAATLAKLCSLSKEKFGDVAKELRECRSKMQLLMKEEPMEENIALMRTMDAHMDELEDREETFWSFFHSKAEQRLHRNNILSIKDEAANDYDEEEKIAEVFVNFYKILFMSYGNIDVDPVECGTMLYYNRCLIRRNVRLLVILCCPFFPQSDCWSWHYSKDGQFLVKSACIQALKETNKGETSTTQSRDGSLWKKLYHAGIPAKIHNFGWRALRNGLPVRANLAHEGINVNPVCRDMEMTISPRCSNASEKDWVMDLMKVYKHVDWWNLFGSIALSIRLGRNKWTF
ncbi:3-methyl-2-oxobutanoate hydroxymethyltransferase [Bienertia sinuspersici]